MDAAAKLNQALDNLHTAQRDHGPASPEATAARHTAEHRLDDAKQSGLTADQLRAAGVDMRHI